MKTLISVIACLLVVLSGPGSVQASPETIREFSGPEERERYRALLGKLRCLVCQNESLASSDADLATFGQGQVHIIVGAPYGWSDWKAFDNDGRQTTLDVLDVELPEEHFFDFTQDHPRKHSSRLAGQGRKAVVAAVCEQLNLQDMGFTIEAMRSPLSTLGYEIVSEVGAYGCFAKGAIKDLEDVLRHCEEAGRTLVDSLE